jgi:hypothetical protein
VSPSRGRIFNDDSPKHQIDWKDCEPEIARTEHSVGYFQALCQHLPWDEANKVEIPFRKYKCFENQFCLLLQEITSPRHSETQTRSETRPALSRYTPPPKIEIESSSRNTLVLKNGNDVHAQNMSKRNKKKDN